MTGLGSVRTITDSNGNVVNKYDYTPFGSIYANNTTENITNRYQYTGREQNPVSDTMYYCYRTYAPGIGRFIQRDPIGYKRGANLYLYVGNRPNVFVDPSGLSAYWRWRWDLVTVITFPIHLAFDGGAAIAEGILIPLIKISNTESNREEEIENALDPSKPCPISASPGTKNAMDDLKKNVKDMAESPGTGLGGPPPMFPINKQDLIVDLAGNIINEGMGAVQEIEIGEDRVPSE